MYIDRFNKRREDFSDLRSYNDYLEEVEDIGAFVCLIIWLDRQNFGSTCLLFGQSISDLICFYLFVPVRAPLDGIPNPWDVTNIHVRRICRLPPTSRCLFGILWTPSRSLHTHQTPDSPRHDGLGTGPLLTGLGSLFHWGKLGSGRTIILSFFVSRHSTKRPRPTCTTSLHPLPSKLLR